MGALIALAHAQQLSYIVIGMVILGILIIGAAAYARVYKGFAREIPYDSSE